MSVIRRFFFAILLLSCCSAYAQQETEALPEIDVYAKLNSIFRVNLQAKNTREGGDPTQLAIGPSLDIYVKPLLSLKRITASDLDDSKARPLVFGAGYRALVAPDAPVGNRMVLTATSHLPLTAALLLTDTNRADLTWSDNKFSWRYRNKVAIERTFSVHSHHISPYVSSEFYYTETPRKWSLTELDAGCLFPFKKYFEFNAYYLHQNNTSKAPNKQLHGIGMVLNIYFARK